MTLGVTAALAVLVVVLGGLLLRERRRSYAARGRYMARLLVLRSKIQDVQADLDDVYAREEMRQRLFAATLQSSESVPLPIVRPGRRREFFS